MNVEEYIHATNAASDADVLFQIFVRKLEGLGFDKVVYSLMTDSPQLKMRAHHGVMRNYPEDWMKHYVEKKYTKLDPIYQTALMSRRPFSWKGVMEQTPLTAKQMRVMHEAEDAGLKSGVALSIRGPSGEVVGVGVASDVRDVNVGEDALSEIYAIVNQFHICYTSKIRVAEEPALLQPYPSLTEREKEILVWCAKNKSNEAIGCILNISRKTVDFHLGNAFKKLQERSRITAVLKACHLGLITI